jgi:hypothetical protein
VRITIERLNNRPVLKKWVWFFIIYGGSVLAFGAVTGVLELCLPK